MLQFKNFKQNHCFFYSDLFCDKSYFLYKIYYKIGCYYDLNDLLFSDFFSFKDKYSDLLLLMFDLKIWFTFPTISPVKKIKEQSKSVSQTSGLITSYDL